MSFRGWTITDFNSNEIPFDKINYKYLAYSAETTQSGNHHWQAFLYTRKKVRMTQLIKWIKESYITTYPTDEYKPPHIEVMCGSFEDNEDYCSKQGKLIEHGVKPKQGARLDLIQIKDDLINRKTDIKDILLTDPYKYHLYGRTLEKIDTVIFNTKIRNHITKGYWLYGPTGCGKTKYLSDLLKDEMEKNNVFIYEDDKGWWDNYRQQDYVVFDDYRTEIKFNKLLTILDGSPFCQVSRRNCPPIKFTSRVCFFTSSMRPDDCYSGIAASDDDRIEQLLRRLEIIEFDKNNPPKIEL